MNLFWDPEVERNLVEEVKQLIPNEAEQEILFDTLRKYQKTFDLQVLMGDLKVVINEPSRIILYEEIRPLIPLRQQIEYDDLSPEAPEEHLRIIRLRHYGNESLGFAVRGGLEHGVGIYVSQVSQNSQAHKQGLQLGDEIVRVNGFTIDEAIHEEVLNLIRARTEIVLKVRGIGMIPVKDNPDDSLKWQYISKTYSDSLDDASTVKSAKSHPSPRLIKLFINLTGALSLGCSISSGTYQTSGIYIQSVKKGSLAEEAGLEVGDQIMEVNGTSFVGISHSEAVVALKQSKHLDLVIKKGSGLLLFKSQSQKTSHSSQSEPTIGSVSAPLDDDIYSVSIKPAYREEDIIQSHLEKMNKVKQVSNNPVPPERQQEEKEEEYFYDVADPNLREISPPAMENYRSQEDRSKKKLKRLGKEQHLYRCVQEHHKEEITKEWQLRLQRYQQDKEEIMRETNRIAGFGENSNFILQAPKPPDVPPKLYLGSTLSSARSTIADELTESEAKMLDSLEQIENRQIRVIKLKPDGDFFGLEVEGGSRSPLGGKIIVSGIYEGHSAYKQGGIHFGDQLLMVDENLLIDITQQEAEEFLGRASKKAVDLVRIVIAVAPPKEYEDEVTYF